MKFHITTRTYLDFEHHVPLKTCFLPFSGAELDKSNLYIQV